LPPLWEAARRLLRTVDNPYPRGFRAKAHELQSDLPYNFGHKRQKSPCAKWGTKDRTQTFVSALDAVAGRFYVLRRADKLRAPFFLCRAPEKASAARVVQRL